MSNMSRKSKIPPDYRRSGVRGQRAEIGDRRSVRHAVKTKAEKCSREVVPRPCPQRDATLSVTIPILAYARIRDTIPPLHSFKFAPSVSPATISDELGT
jgi:hypothetical protein